MRTNNINVKEGKLRLMVRGLLCAALFTLHSSLFVLHLNIFAISSFETTTGALMNSGTL